MSKLLKLFSFIFFILLATFPIYADDTPPPNAGSQRYFCLSSVPNGGHTAKLSIDTAKYQPIAGPVYVFVRINGLLTTGDPVHADIDTLKSRSNYDTLQRTIGFRNAGLTDSANPVPDAAKFPVNWHDDLDKDKASEHFWFGMQVANTTGTGGNGDTGGQQQGTFKWAILAGSSECAHIKWDPLGYVFDAQTLGVIPGAMVTIYDASKTPPVMVPPGPGKGQVATNPFPTLNNGTFSFFTDPGAYSFKIAGKYNNKNLVITDPTILNAVNPDYQKYGYTNLYKPGSSVVEAEGQTVRTDIAVNTVGAPIPILGTPQLSDVDYLSAGDQMQVVGTVKFYTPATPNAKVIPVYIEPATQVERQGSVTVPIGANGGFLFLTDKSIQVDDKTYVLSRLDLVVLGQGGATTQRPGYFDKFIAFVSNLFIVHAAPTSSSVSINPVPSYLEGIARDTKGLPVASALVGLYLQGSNAPVYQTRSDINGHYVIGSQDIPILPYEIHITLVTGEVIPLSTMEYLKQNAIFHKENNINSFAIVQTSSSVDDTGTLIVTKTVITPASATNGSNSGNNKGGGPNNNNGSSTQQSPTSISGMGSGTQGIIMIVVAILMLIMIGVGAFIVMKSKQQPLPPQY